VPTAAFEPVQVQVMALPLLFALREMYISQTYRRL